MTCTTRTLHFETLAIHAGQAPDPAYGAVMTPIYQTSTFAFKGVNQPGPFDYSRSGNPTRKALEDCLAALEGGTHGFAFATGQAAEATVLTLFGSGRPCHRPRRHLRRHLSADRQRAARERSARSISSTCATWTRLPRRSASIRAPYGRRRPPTR